ncbi:MAG TPA: PilZ domain-containing protein [Kofleriaceae bacterium]|nr:PilZ domain-containing protein [Kofleriaceae bacterium]
MADDATGAKKAPTVLRIKLRYDDLDTFVERFAPNIARAGLFIRTRTPKPVGSEIRFELRLADDKPVVVGLGVVRWIKEYDPRRPRAAHGMGVEFTRVTRESREVLLRVLEHRKKHGMVDGERGLPVPLDDDDAVPVRAARDQHSAPPRVIDPTGSASQAEPVEVPARDEFRTGPVAAPARPARTTAPPPVVAKEPEPPLPDPVAEPSPVAMPSSLTPEPTRRPRPSFESLIANVAAPAADAQVDDDALIAFLSEGLDVAATIARARIVAGSDADAELDALLSADAAPAEISIDDASSRLAAMFGMNAVAPRRRVEFAEGTREANPVAASEPEAPPAPEPDDNEGITHPIDPDVLALAAAADATPVTPIEKSIEKPIDKDDSGDFSDSERTAIADPAVLARAAAASAASDDDVDAPTIAVPFDDGATGLRSRDQLRPPPRGEFESDVDVDTLVKAGEQRANQLPPPPSRGKSRTMPPPPPMRGHAPTQPQPTSDPAIDVAQARESSSGSIDITGLVEQLEAEIAQPAPMRDELELGATAMNADELLDGMRDIGRRRPPSGPAPDLASFADPPDAQSAPRGRVQRGTTADDALAALESLSFDEAAEETAVSKARDVARAPYRPPTPRPARAKTPPPVQKIDQDDEDQSIEIDIDIDLEDDE